MKAGEPIDHVQRLRPPWRTERLTECGLAITDDDKAGAGNVLTPVEYAARVRNLGHQRAAMVTCMTCVNHAYYDARVHDGRMPTWLDDPASVVGRDCTRRYGSTREDEGRRARAEWHALALLIDAHRDEFDATVEGILGASTLDAARKAKAEREAKVKRGRSGRSL